MRTTVEIEDELLSQARRLASRTRRPLRAVIEEGLRLAIREGARPERYILPDCSVGDPTAPDPLAGRTWEDIRAEIYRGRGGP